MMIGRGSILALLLATCESCDHYHNSSGSLGPKWRHLQASQHRLLSLCVHCKQKKELATTWLDHYFQVRGNIAVNSEVSSWLGGVCTVLRALCTASYVGVTLRRILVSYASGRKLKSSGHHFISKTSSRSQPSITTSQYQ